MDEANSQLLEMDAQIQELYDVVSHATKNQIDETEYNCGIIKSEYEEAMSSICDHTFVI